MFSTFQVSPKCLILEIITAAHYYLQLLLSKLAKRKHTTRILKKVLNYWLPGYMLFAYILLFVFVKYATFILEWIFFLLRLSKNVLNWNDIFHIEMFEIKCFECNLRLQVWKSNLQVWKSQFSKRIINHRLSWVLMITRSTSTAQKMKFSIQDFTSTDDSNFWKKCSFGSRKVSVLKNCQ